MTADPIRWTDGAPGVSASLLDAVRSARAESPSQAQIARMTVAVGVAVGAQAASNASTAATRTLRSWTRAHALGISALAALATAGALWTWRTHSAPARPPHRREPSVAAAHFDAPDAPLLAPPQPAAPKSPPVQALAPPPASAQAMRATSNPSTAVDPAAEVALLLAARRALVGDPARALVLASEHRRRYSHGALVEEREAIEIEALLNLGQRQRAQLQADRFHRRYPASVYGRRIDHLLAATTASPAEANEQ